MKHHTKAARRRAFRAYHRDIAQEAMAAHAGRCLAAWLRAQMLASPFAVIRAEAARVTTAAGAP